MKNNYLSVQPHRRYNPLKDEWILVSSQRTKRPWYSQKEILKEILPSYDASCYLCPGNLRANGEKNPGYKTTYVFPNDFPAIINTGSVLNNQNSELFPSESVKGECKVVCFSPKHNLTLAQMTEIQIKQVIQTWINELYELEKKFKWVQIFENKGALMGCSNFHPHGQIWASNFIPTEVQKEDRQQKKYFEKNRSVLLLDYVKEELKIKSRIVAENETWVVLVPFWAVWPFETLLLPKTHKPQFTSISNKENKGLAEIMKKLLVAYDKLFATSMPYSMGWHFAPLDTNSNKHWQLHAHYYPPLLRSANVKKFMVGYEMLAEPQRDITAEQAAEKLRNLL